MNRRAIAILFALCLLGEIAYSQTPDARLKPMRNTEIESEQFSMKNDGEEAYLVFSDSVVLTGTNLELKCDKMEVFVQRVASEEANIGDFGAIEKILATGNVRITQAERVAIAGLAEVQPNEEQIVLRENPRILQPGYTLTGLEIIIKRGQGVVIIPGDEANKVRFVGPTIKDLGFETDKSIKVEPTEEEDGSETESENDSEESEAEQE